MSGLNQSLVCVCGRSFAQSSAYTKHSKGCQAGKKRLSDVLAHAQETLRKKRRVQTSAGASESCPGPAASVQVQNFHFEEAQSTTVDSGHVGGVVGMNSHVTVLSFPTFITQ
jgi:hypothetical protein